MIDKSQGFKGVWVVGDVGLYVVGAAKVVKGINVAIGVLEEGVHIDSWVLQEHVEPRGKIANQVLRRRRPPIGVLHRIGQQGIKRITDFLGL